MSPHAPKGTPGEWTDDPYEKNMGLQPIDPGYCLPFYIVSPLTRNGGVFTEHSAHESQILSRGMVEGDWPAVGVARN